MRHQVLQRVKDFTNDRNSIQITTTITEIALIAASENKMHQNNTRNVIGLISFLLNLSEDLNEKPNMCLGTCLELMFLEIQESIQFMRENYGDEFESSDFKIELDRFESSITNFEVLLKKSSMR